MSVRVYLLVSTSLHFRRHDRGVFGFAISLRDGRERLRSVLDAQWRVCAGAAFVVLALASIQYDEIIAPGMNHFSDACSDFGRRVSSITR